MTNTAQLIQALQAFPGDTEVKIKGSVSDYEGEHRTEHLMSIISTTVLNPQTDEVSVGTVVLSALSEAR